MVLQECVKNCQDSLEQEVNNLRNDADGIPIAVGFGISTTEQAKEVSRFADGVVVGSRLVKELGFDNGHESFYNLAQSLCESIDT